MFVNYALEIEHITKDFEKKVLKKLNIESLINL